MGREQSNLVLLVSDDEAFRGEATPYLKALLSPAWSIASCSYEEVAKRSAGSSPAVVFIHLAKGDNSIIPSVQRISSCFQNSKIVYVGNSLTMTFIHRLIQLGAKDFLQLPFQEDGVRSILRQNVAPISRNFGKVVTIFSPKGGTGVTLLTINLAVVLSQQPSCRVAVCDLSPQSGGVATYLNLSPKYTLRDLIDNHQLLDVSLLEGTMLRHPSGVHVLAAPREDQEPLNFNHLSEFQSALSLLRLAYDVTLIDVGHCDTALLQQALMQSDLILLLGNLDLPSFKGLVSALNHLTRLGYDPDRIKLVINRYNAKSQLDTKELEKTVRHPVACCLPNNYPLCIEAINTGRPIGDIQEGSNLARKIAELVEVVQKSLNGVTSHDTSTAQPRLVQNLEPAKRGILRWLI